MTKPAPTDGDIRYHLHMHPVSGLWQVVELSAEAVSQARGVDTGFLFSAREKAEAALAKALHVQVPTLLRQLTKLDNPELRQVIDNFARERGFTVPLGNAQNRNLFNAGLTAPDPAAENQEIGVCVFTRDGELVADLLIGVADEGQELRVLTTTDANGMGDKNVEIYPLRAAAQAVEVDFHNAQLAKDRG